MIASLVLGSTLLAVQAPVTSGLERAEELVRAGRYGDARAAYAKLADDQPASAAGQEAALRARPSAYLGWADVVRNGPSANRIDIVLMGDGYELEHLKAFDKLAADIPPLFERQETFREYYGYFNFVRAVLLSKDSGVDGFGREYDTAVGGRTAATFAGHVSVDTALVHSYLRRIPDSDGQAIVFVKNGVLGTGGAGVATIGGREVRTVIHEFGHSFGWLGDEYQSAQSHAQGTGPVRDCANVCGSGDPQAAPWSHWIAAKHPGVDMCEGAAGRVKGAWRPTTKGCVMSSADEFCIVCREALVLRIYSIVDPLESCKPEPIAQGAQESLTLGDEPLEFHAEVLRPARHALEVSWYLLPAAALPASGESGERSSGSRFERAGLAEERGERGGRGGRDRTRRGPLPQLEAEPLEVSRNDQDGVHDFVLSRKGLEPGRYRLVCRVRDTTLLRGEKWPWVLSDPDGLLESERGWWIEVAPRAGN